MSKLTRLPEWHDFLKLYIDRCQDIEFRWGEHDCVRFCAGAVKAITGTDLSEGQGSYSSEEEALQYLRDKGYKTLRGAITKKLGKPVHPAQAGKGDIVYTEDARGKQVGVCVGKWTWFVGETPTGMTREDGTPILKQGLVPVPTLSCKLAWKVG